MTREVVKVPLVGAHRSVEPHGVIEAGTVIVAVRVGVVRTNGMGSID